MPDWRCNRCGHVHGTNPTVCSNCGNTILNQARPGNRGAMLPFLIGLVLGIVIYAYLWGLPASVTGLLFAFA